METIYLRDKIAMTIEIKEAHHRLFNRTVMVSLMGEKRFELKTSKRLWRPN